MVCFKTLAKFFQACIPARTYTFSLVPMKGFLRVSGDVAAAFLQGLITNDISSLSPSNPILHSLVLNVKGRILSDVFIYKLLGKCSHEYYLLEVHLSCLHNLLEHLSKYNLRNKVKIQRDDSVSVWIILPTCGAKSCLTDLRTWPFKNPSTTYSKYLLCYAFDPRGVPGWSGRFILPTGFSASSIFNTTASESRIEDYHLARWRLGLPEGPVELIPNKTFPLEANADLSETISFSKGCYVGQELTSRTRFTGVVRQRLLPIRLAFLDKSQSNQLAFGCYYPGTSLWRTDMEKESCDSSLGCVRALCHWTDGLQSYLEGLALLQLDGATESNLKRVISLKNSVDQNQPIRLAFSPYFPYWWPKLI